MSHNTKTRNQNIIRIQKFTAYGVLWAYTALKCLNELVIVSVLHTGPNHSKRCKNKLILPCKATAIPMKYISFVSSRIQLHQ